MSAVDIYAYAYVEDVPSAEAVKKLAAYRNSCCSNPLKFKPGFPQVMHGNGAIRRKSKAMLAASKVGQLIVAITDLDKYACAPALMREWLSIPAKTPIVIPKSFLFRVAVREVESWILADHKAWADFIKIPAANFSTTPDDLPDPKKHILDVISRKGTKGFHREMIPRGTAHIGPKYNDTLVEFIQSRWSIERAQLVSPSLKSAVNAFCRI